MAGPRKHIDADSAVAMIRGFVDGAEKRNETETAEWWNRIIVAIAERRTTNFNTSDGVLYIVDYPNDGR